MELPGNKIHSYLKPYSSESLTAYWLEKVAQLVLLDDVHTTNACV